MPKNAIVISLPVCPLFVIVVWFGSKSKPFSISGGIWRRFTVNESILMGLWCFPKHVLYCSPQWFGPLSPSYPKSWPSDERKTAKLLTFIIWRMCLFVYQTKIKSFFFCFVSTGYRQSMNKLSTNFLIANYFNVRPQIIWRCYRRPKFI